MRRCVPCLRERLTAGLLARLAALLAGGAVGAITLVAGAPVWASVGFGCVSGFNVFLVYLSRLPQ